MKPGMPDHDYGYQEQITASSDRGEFMAIKQTPKIISRKKAVKPAVTQKSQGSRPDEPQMSDIPKIVDIQAKQIYQLNKTVSSLQEELKEIRGMIRSNEGTGTEVKPAQSAKTSAPARVKATEKKVPTPKKAPVAVSKAPTKAPARTSKALTVQENETKAITVKPAAKKATTPTKKPVKPTALKETGESKVATPARRGRKTAQTVSSEAPVAIPSNIADRINALTTKKKITQTKFGEEVDLPQKVIYDISERKLKTLSLEKIQKITAVLKKYESK